MTRRARSGSGSRLALLSAAAVLIPGCLGSEPGRVEAEDAIRLVPLPAIGDAARYVVEGASTGTLDVHLSSVRVVFDAHHAERESVLIHRWWNASDGDSSHLVDAVDARDGTYVWIQRVCESSEFCEGKSAFFFNVAGWPAYLGRTALASGEIERERDCVRRASSDAPHQRLLAGGWIPEPLFEGRATFCAAFPLPSSVEDVRGTTTARLASWSRGSGRVLAVAPWTGAAEAPVSADARAWNGHFPVGPEPPMAFTIGEAWTWASENDRAFQAFLRAHPDAYVSDTWQKSTGGGGVVHVPVLGSPATLTHAGRLLRVQAPTGETLALTLAKRTTTTPLGSESNVSREDIKETREPPRLDLDALETRMVTPEAATRVGRAWLAGEWRETQFLAGEPVVGATLGVYHYRVLAEPAGGAPVGVIYPPDQIVLRADSLAPVHFLGDEAWMGVGR